MWGHFQGAQKLFDISQAGERRTQKTSHLILFTLFHRRRRKKNPPTCKNSRPRVVRSSVFSGKCLDSERDNSNEKCHFIYPCNYV